MEDFGCFWSYQESLDEARQQLLYTTLELQTLKMEANEKMRKHRDQVKQLIQLINTANKERDEARDQLQTILNKLIVKSPFVNPIKPNSVISESNSHISLNSSPVDSFFDGVSSFEITNRFDFAGKMNPADAVIESIVKGKFLPEKGRLLEAMMEADPLLQTVVVPQPVPQWRNPPPMPESVEIPQISVGRSTWRSAGSQLFSAAKRQRLH